MFAVVVESRSDGSVDAVFAEYKGELRAIVGFEGNSDWFSEVKILPATEEKEVLAVGLTNLLTLVGHRLYAL
jgi:hypothetical protein